MIQLFLVLHVLGAIAVFGPTFAFPLISRQAAQSPQNGHFAAVVMDMIERRIVIPGAIVQGITGVVLIVLTGWYPNAGTYLWLSVSIVLYLIAVLYAIFVQAPAAEKMVKLTAGGPPGGAPPSDAPSSGAPAGPPPEIAATAQRLARGGMFLTVMIVLIVILMVVKPTF
jgi:Predicted integral membrane protein (DUF2269)